MAAKDRKIDAGTIDVTLAMWDAAGVGSTPDEALNILRVVAGQGTCTYIHTNICIIYYNNPMHLLLHAQLNGPMIS